MNPERVHQILLAPVISEKAPPQRTTATKWYSGFCRRDQVGNRKAVESQFQVTVEAVQVMNVRGR